MKKNIFSVLPKIKEFTNGLCLLFRWRPVLAMYDTKWEQIAVFSKFPIFSRKVAVADIFAFVPVSHAFMFASN